MGGWVWLPPAPTLRGGLQLPEPVPTLCWGQPLHPTGTAGTLQHPPPRVGQDPMDLPVPPSMEQDPAAPRSTPTVPGSTLRTPLARAWAGVSTGVEIRGGHTCTNTQGRDPAPPALLPGAHLGTQFGGVMGWVQLPPTASPRGCPLQGSLHHHPRPWKDTATAGMGGHTQPPARSTLPGGLSRRGALGCRDTMHG